jgi:hypothetical protein
MSRILVSNWDCGDRAAHSPTTSVLDMSCPDIKSVGSSKSLACKTNNNIFTYDLLSPSAPKHSKQPARIFRPSTNHGTSPHVGDRQTAALCRT